MKQIIKERIINKSKEFLYEKWTTKDGLNSFFSQDNNIEVKPFGKYEIYFTKDSLVKARGSEGCIVLSFIPNKMISFTWNVPPQFKELRDAKGYTWVVIEFLKADDNTLVRLTNLGYPDDILWDSVYRYFDSAWDIVMDRLVKSCE